MTPTNEQIIAEADRRWLEEYKTNGGRLNSCSSKELHVINIMRENWTPPEPEVDPDILAFREWAAELWTGSKECILEGVWDQGTEASAYLAGARMAREQERERAKPLVEYATGDAVRLDNVGVRARAAIAKYEEGGR